MSATVFSDTSFSFMSLNLYKCRVINLNIKVHLIFFCFQIHKEHIVKRELFLFYILLLQDQSLYNFITLVNPEAELKKVVPEKIDLLLVDAIPRRHQRASIK